MNGRRGSTESQSSPSLSSGRRSVCPWRRWTGGHCGSRDEALVLQGGRTVAGLTTPKLLAQELAIHPATVRRALRHLGRLGKVLPKNGRFWDLNDHDVSVVREFLGRP